MVLKVVSRVFAATVVGGFLAFSSVSGATAATVNVTYQGSTAFGSPDLSRYLQISSTGYNGGVFAGPFRLNGDNGMGNFVAFCVDLAQFLKSGTTYTTAASSGYGGGVDTRIGQLFSSAYAGISTRVQGAAFQVALWEIISDTGAGYSLSGGTFKVKQAAYSQAVINQANNYLAALTGATTGGYRLTYLKSAVGQDIVTVSQVPLPAAAGMLGLGLASLVGLRRRKKKA
jgi:hypothetical protein